MFHSAAQHRETGYKFQCEADRDQIHGGQTAGHSRHHDCREAETGKAANKPGKCCDRRKQDQVARLQGGQLKDGIQHGLVRHPSLCGYPL
ncbi:MAG: hypothetical protein R3D32_04080 [Nitratireductor sp.]